VTGSDTRQLILDAALECFLREGYERSTIAAIRERSGVSNGALFHHFATKDAIADALFVDAMASFQDGLWALLARRPRSLRAAVRGTIEHQLGWIEEHPEWARFVYLRGHLDWDSSAGRRVAALNESLAAAFQEWMAPLVRRGEVRETSMLIVTALVTAPAHAIARRWLAGQLPAKPTAYAEELIDAAVAGLGGPSARRRRARGTSAALEPARGRVSLQLLSGDGRLLAGGEAIAELLPAHTTTFTGEEQAS
jgi:AcrR family transcriptional regulator